MSVKPMPGSLPGMEMLQLSVQDTGCGIPREKQKLVFDAFGQVRWHLGLYLTCCAAGRICHSLASCSCCCLWFIPSYMLLASPG